MTAVFATTSAVLAVVDWWAVAVGRQAVERWAKPAVMLALGAAVAVSDAPAAIRWPVLVAIAFGLVGDIALLDDGETRFLVGLGSFAVGHVAYAVAAWRVGFDSGWAVPGVVVVAALLGYRFTTRIVPGSRRAGGTVMAGAVCFYAVVIGVMVVSSWGTGVLVAGIGASLFAVSDWLIGHQRFIGPTSGGDVAVMVLYHLGQFGLVAGLLWT